MPKVLIVDDSPTETHVMRATLEKNGFEVLAAEDGESGLKMAREALPDVIIMDVVMPGMNGFQATRAISKDPETQHIPIIIVSTKDQETDRVWGMRQGAKDYISKPVIEEDFMSKIASALGK